MKAFWRERLTALKSQIEGGWIDEWPDGLLLGLTLWIGFPLVL
jgi:hypothetical protein